MDPGEDVDDDAAADDDDEEEEEDADAAVDDDDDDDDVTDAAAAAEDYDGRDDGDDDDENDEDGDVDDNANSCPLSRFLLFRLPLSSYCFFLTVFVLYKILKQIELTLRFVGNVLVEDSEECSSLAPTGEEFVVLITKIMGNSSLDIRAQQNGRMVKVLFS